MAMYTVLQGKHWVKEGGQLKSYPKGSQVELTEEEAAAFPGRFALVVEPEEEKPAPKGKASTK